MDVQLDQVSVINELNRIGWAFEAQSDEELSCNCPGHDDTTRSCSINVEKRLFNCKSAGCKAKGDFITFLSLALKTPRRVILEDLVARYGGDGKLLVDGEAVERWHQDIWGVPAAPFRAELTKRGVTDDDIRQYRIGFDGKRITIPIKNESGAYVNVRKYLPGAPGPEKMKNLRGHGKIRLFPLEQLKYETLILCGGEMKAIATASRMNRHGIGAITTTGGEGSWRSEFNKELAGKKVFVCQDIDAAGKTASESLCASIRAHVEWVGNLLLPLDPDKYPKGDINDYWGAEKHTPEDLLDVLLAVQKWEPEVLREAAAEAAPSEAEDIHLSQASEASHTTKRIRTRGVVAAMDDTPYIVPKTVRCSCSRESDFCAICNVYAQTPDPDTGAVTLSISPESPAILSMVGASKSAQKDAIRDALRVPPCKKVSFKPIEFYNVQDARMSPQLTIASRAADHIEQIVYIIGHGVETNSSYEVEGRCFPHPKNQQAVILASKATPTEDALIAFKPGEEQCEALKLFQPKEWTTAGIQEKLDDLYADLETNVTRIFKRRDLHLVADLVYHTVLLMQLDGRKVKGWGEALICGDSSQGKSETLLRLMEHYGVGERVECKNATVPGLLGGLKERGTRFFIAWGVIPTHDKRLVVLEELKGASTEVIGKLTDMRSSGVAEIPKIEKRRTHARTRLIAISNPRSDRPVAMYNFGIETVKELIGGLEDIRRFDIALLVASSQINAEELNELVRHRPVVEHVHTSELCQRLVLWAWTREETQVVFEPEATDSIVDYATHLCKEFSEAVPLIDRGTTRHKIARLACGLACRTFSCDETMQKVVVRKCHVQYIAEMMERIYADDVFGYKDFSAAVRINDDLKDPNEIKRKVLQLPFPKDFVDSVLYTNDLELRDLCDWCGFDRGDGIELLSFLVRHRALQRERSSYRKTSAFIAFLKTLKESGTLQSRERPSYVKERF